MKAAQIDMLSGEELLLTKNASAMIHLKPHGFNWSSHQGYWLLGIADPESTFGKLYLTTYRLVFVTNPTNRITGELSLFLPTITALEESTRYIAKRMVVKTGIQSFEFVLWGIPNVVAQIRLVRDALSPARRDALRALAHRVLPPPVAGLQALAREGADAVPLTVGELWTLIAIARNPLGAATLLNLLELYTG